MTTKRQQRMDNKYRGQLLCENCNRWTSVPMDVWREALKNYRERGTQYICLCDRRTCKMTRPEGLLDRLSPRQRDNIIYATNYNSSSQKDQENPRKQAHNLFE
jgi:hypothetical protein